MGLGLLSGASGLVVGVAPAVRTSSVSMMAKEKAPQGLGEWLMQGRDRELLSGAVRKDNVQKRFDVSYDTRTKSKPGVKVKKVTKSGTIKKNDASTW